MSYKDAKQEWRNKKRFFGLRNLQQSRRADEGEDRLGISLSATLNIDIDDEGGIINRPGYSLTTSGTNIISAYALRDHSAAYIIDNGNLIKLTQNSTGLLSTTIGTVPNQDTYFVEVGNQLFLSSGYIVNNGTLIPWAVNPPGQPVGLVTSGNLLAGTYQITCTYISADGRESGSCQPIVLNVPANGGIQLIGTFGLNVYMTQPNGDVLIHIGKGVTNITSINSAGYPIANELLNAFTIPSNIGPIAYYDSSTVYSIYDQSTNLSTVVYSKPFRFHVFSPEQDFIRVPNTVRLLVGTEDALIIGTDKEIFSFDGLDLKRLARYGVPPGKIYQYSRDNELYFQTLRGVCKLPFQNLTEEKISVPYGTYCATGLISQNGLEKFITVTDGSGGTEDATVF